MSAPRPSAVGDFFRGMLAVARLTMLESHRQHWWWFVLVAMAGLLLIIPSLDVVDADAQLKLAVSAISGTIAFMITLIAVFVVIIAVRRDLETRCSFMLFAKPLPRLAYCCGRWLGTMCTLALAVLLMSLAGAGAIRLQLNELPVPQVTVTPDSWQQVDQFGAVSTLRGDEQRVVLPQPSGSGVILEFTGLDPQAGDQSLLIKALVRGDSGFTPTASAPMQATLLLPDGTASKPLVLADSSPLGRTNPDGSTPPTGQFSLRHRSAERRDLNGDYVRLQLPVQAIAGDGSLRLHLMRVESAAGIIFSRQNGIMVSAQGAPFIVDLLIAGMINLAQAGVVAAAALLLVIISGIGTSLLGCLTLFFGGHAVAFVAEVASSSRSSEIAKRLVDLIVPIVPYFARFEVAANLAALQSLSALTIGDAWLYFGLWIVAFMACAWFTLLRREL